MMTRSSSISKFWWLWMPILFLVMQAAIEIFVPKELRPGLHSEWGPHEALQSVFITAAFFVALFTLPKIDWKTQRLIGIWFALAAICSLYVSGEEISWGQHILSWDTPGYWSQFNDQNETNFHNTSAWLDQKPRLILFIGIVVGGLIIPALRRWKPSVLPTKFEVFYPADILVVSALGVAVPYVLDDIWRNFLGGRLFTRESELQELYMYYFIMLYLVDMRQRIFIK